MTFSPAAASCRARVRPRPPALDREAALGPLLAPADQLAEGPRVDDEATLAGFVAGGVAGDSGVRGLVGSIPMMITRILTWCSSWQRCAVGTLT
ncbi:hypothetical protein [Streptomyces sp. NPDC057686]|uniref:hypothetical protein n=1 Tax=Streptomyces sp. NPDC057686 TaxID=3346212 RepID=UPI003694F998